MADSAMYDNPATGERETYRRGKLTSKVSREMIERTHRQHGEPGNVPVWRPGEIRGSESNLPKRRRDQ